jgi:hypothetical protein
MILLMLGSCSKHVPGTSAEVQDFRETVMQPREFAKWVDNEQHDLKHEKVIGEMKYSIRFNPASYMAMIELKNEDITSEKWSEALSHYSDMEYYKFTIEMPGASGELMQQNLSSSQEYTQRLEYYSFAFANDIKMVCNGDTIPCGLSHFERTFNVAPKTSFLIAFTKQSSDMERTLIINDRVFGKGRIKFLFTPSDLNNHPKVQL